MAIPHANVQRFLMEDHLRDSSLPTDVTFVLHVFESEDVEQRTHTHDVVFPAHRDRLLAASPFFECLLAGSRSVDRTMLNWKHANEISIEDCPPDAFSALLRWIYGDQEILDGVCQSTFVGVILAADRFGMKDLVSRLLGQARHLITVDLFREILDVLEHQQIECANELHKECLAYFDGLLEVDRFFEILDVVEHRQMPELLGHERSRSPGHPSFVNISHERLVEILATDSLRVQEIDLYCAVAKWVRAELNRCLNYLDKNAAALVKHASFVDISHERLTKVLARNSLCVHEIDLYRGATEWARAQAKRARKRRTDEAIREALGEALFLIRFPTMHPQEFKNGPAKDNILAAEEKLAVYDRILSEGPTSCAFSAEPRTGASTLPLRRFTPTYCQLCGKRLDDNDTCPVCGCCYLPSVECDRCDMRVHVGYGPFNFSWHLHNDGGYALVYQCSCGALNLSLMTTARPTDAPVAE